MPTLEETAETIINLLRSCNNAIPSLEEFIAISKNIDSYIERTTEPTPYPIKDEEELRQCHQSLRDLQGEFGCRGPIDTEEQLRGRTEEGLDDLWEKIELAKGTALILSIHNENM